MNLLKFFKRDKTPVPMCKDCKWFGRGVLIDYCKSPHVQENAPRKFSFAYGWRPIYGLTGCEDERKDRHPKACGRKARYFTPRFPTAS